MMDTGIAWDDFDLPKDVEDAVDEALWISWPPYPFRRINEALMDGLGEAFATPPRFGRMDWETLCELEGAIGRSDTIVQDACDQIMAPVAWACASIRDEVTEIIRQTFLTLARRDHA